jgi:hypothetical protein
VGPEHEVVAESLNGLALLYQTQGKFGQAEPLRKRALVRIPMKTASDSDGKVATHSDPKWPLWPRVDLAGVIVAVG